VSRDAPGRIGLAPIVDREAAPGALDGSQGMRLGQGPLGSPERVTVAGRGSHHDVNGLFQRMVHGAPDEAAQPVASWLPAAEGRLENGTYVIQLAAARTSCSTSNSAYSATRREAGAEPTTARR
jgi:hypothetical protein